jgi:hypothetical protein
MARTRAWLELGLAASLLLAPMLIACGDASETADGETAGTAETDGTAQTGGTAETGDGDGDGDASGDGDGDTGPGPDTGDPGPMGIFVAVGDGGRRASSTDALSWDEIIGSGVIDTQAEMGEEDILRAIAVGDGVLIAVGGGGTDWTGNAMIMRSSDGVSWEENLVGGMDGLDDRKLDAIGYADGVFIAAGHQAHILRSDDAGSSWTRVYPEHPPDTTGFGVAGHAGTFVVVGSHRDAYDQPKVAYVQRSLDAGLTFEAPMFFGEDGDHLTSVASNGERFVAVGPKQCLRSSDGATWDPCGLAALPLGGSFGGVTIANEYFVVTYLDGVSTSEDGETWSAHFESSAGVPNEIFYGNGVYAGVRFYDRGTSEALVDWSFMTHGGFPLRDLAFLPLE